MGKKLLVITSSLRNSSNSDALADEFIRGAEANGNEVKRISLKGKSIKFCRGCMACGKLGHCAITDDDANPIAEDMKNADAIAFATPVYYFGMPGQLKALLDRANSLFYSDYSFRDIYLLASAAETGNEAVKGTEDGIKWWVECFDKAIFRGTVFAGGVYEPGKINGHKVLNEAYKLGLSI